MVSPRSLSVYRVPSSACSETVQQMVREPHGSCSAPPSSSSFSLVHPSYLILTFTFFFCIIHEASSLQFALSLTSSASFSCPVFRVLFSSFASYTSSSISCVSLPLIFLLSRSFCFCFLFLVFYFLATCSDSSLHRFPLSYSRYFISFHLPLLFCSLRSARFTVPFF